VIEVIKKWWPSALCLLAVLWLTLAPDPVPDNDLPLFPGADKIVHAIMMGGLTATLLYDASRKGGKYPKPTKPRVILMIGLGVVIFSIADEWAQSAMNIGRTAESLDLIADITGILIAVITGLILATIYR